MHALLSCLAIGCLFSHEAYLPINVGHFCCMFGLLLVALCLSGKFCLQLFLSPLILDVTSPTHSRLNCMALLLLEVAFFACVFQNMFAGHL
jgi:hypothetical protein